MFKLVANHIRRDRKSLAPDATADANCAGLILVDAYVFTVEDVDRGLNLLKRPLLHLHTQFNRDMPWDTIDMDFMNLNQAAHGDREAGFIHDAACASTARSSSDIGPDPDVQQRMAPGCAPRAAWHDWQGARFCRFGDNMREVAVTEATKSPPEMRFGFSRQRLRRRRPGQSVIN